MMTDRMAVKFEINECALYRSEVGLTDEASHTIGGPRMDQAIIEAATLHNVTTFMPKELPL
jgi:hypothetical protein